MAKPVAARLGNLLDIAILGQRVQDALHCRGALIEATANVPHANRLVYILEQVQHGKTALQRKIPSHKRCSLFRNAVPICDIKSSNGSGCQRRMCTIVCRHIVCVAATISPWTYVWLLASTCRGFGVDKRCPRRNYRSVRDSRARI